MPMGRASPCSRAERAFRQKRLSPMETSAFGARTAGDYRTSRNARWCPRLPSTRCGRGTTQKGSTSSREPRCPAGSESASTLDMRSTSCIRWPRPSARPSNSTRPFDSPPAHPYHRRHIRSGTMREEESTMNRRVFLTTTAAGAATFAFPAVLRAQSKDPIRIGFPAPLTGPFSAIAADMKQGAELAVDELNAKGGILGRKVEVLIRDDQLKPQVGAQRTQELIEKEGCQFIVGGLAAHVQMAINEQTKT